MKIRALHRLLAAVAVGLLSIPAIAQYSNDASANQKIDEAINNHYLMMELDKAENLLTSTIASCEDKCSPQTKAKAWMYVGIVRGSGKQDQSGAAQAFSAAKGLDPSVSLDADLASDDTKSTFQGAHGGAAVVPPPSEEVEESSEEPTDILAAGAAAAPPPAGAPGDMLCSPQGAMIGLNMPIPISCSTTTKAKEGFIKFLEPGGSSWKKVDLHLKKGQWQASIPCEFTGKSGQLQFYVGVKDRTGEYVDQFGSKKDPAAIPLGEGGIAPSFPGEEPVTACMGVGPSASDCPPDFPGCSTGSKAVCGDMDWGASCNNSTQCKCGLLCESGQCATAPTCSENSDCATGACVDGYCSALATDNDNATAGPFKRSWLSFAAGLDIMPYGGAALCTEERYSTYGIRCYVPSASGSGMDRVNDRSDIGTNNGGVGMTMGQMRLKLGYDFAITHHLTVGARLGIAFLNSHPKPKNDPGDGGFLPLHLAVRAGWTFTSLAHKGFRPTLYLEGGMTESNGHLRYPGAGDTVDVYKVGGRGFVAPGLSLGYAISAEMAINLDVQYMMLFPSGGFAQVIHPGLSFVYGL